jgi:hypothetical protein
MPFDANPGQIKATAMLVKGKRHSLIYGGARSGKTFLLTRACCIRAMRSPASRHIAVRFRGNAVWTSIGMDTFPKVMRECFPGVPYKTHRQDGFFEFPNRSEFWLGGLDDKDRAEKILGQEYATLYLNECSQIPYSSVLVARTRLAQVCDGIEQRAFYDLNPSGTGHWTYREFVQKQTIDGRPLANGDSFAHSVINPYDNRANLSPEFLKELDSLPEKQRRRFLLGEYVAEIEGALWTLDRLAQCRLDMPEGVPLNAETAQIYLPALTRIVVAIDPSGNRGDDDKRSDEVGIVVAAKGVDGRAYVLEDLTCNLGPAGWARLAVAAYHRWKADAIVAEINFGGAMVEHVIKTEDGGVNYIQVTATRGKWVRAEPIAALYDLNQDKVRHVGRLDKLEDQLCQFSTAGYMGERSPDRADAMVWALTELMLGDKFDLATYLKAYG